MPQAPEILDLLQGIVDNQSATDTLQQQIADSLAQKNTEINSLKDDAKVKDQRIADLEAQVGSSIDPAAVVAATNSLAAVTADIANTPVS